MKRGLRQKPLSHLNWFIKKKKRRKTFGFDELLVKHRDRTRLACCQLPQCWPWGQPSPTLPLSSPCAPSPGASLRGHPGMGSPGVQPPAKRWGRRERWGDAGARTDPGCSGIFNVKYFDAFKTSRVQTFPSQLFQNGKGFLLRVSGWDILKCRSWVNSSAKFSQCPGHSQPMEN